MVQKSGKLTSWYGKNAIACKGFHTYQVVVWDFWTINSPTERRHGCSDEASEGNMNIADFKTVACSLQSGYTKRSDGGICVDEELEGFTHLECMW